MKRSKETQVNMKQKRGEKKRKMKESDEEKYDKNNK